MNMTTDPYSGLRLVELSHEWGHGVPSYPGQDDVKMFRGVKHAQHGVLAWKINTVMHTGTHMNAPLHLVQKAADLASIPVDRLFGNGVVLAVPKKSYAVVTAKDLQSAKPEFSKAMWWSSSPAGITNTPMASSISAHRRDCPRMLQIGS
jgi:kynurenine formamidase